MVNLGKAGAGLVTKRDELEAIQGIGTIKVGVVGLPIPEKRAMGGDVAQTIGAGKGVILPVTLTRAGFVARGQEAPRVPYVETQQIASIAPIIGSGTSGLFGGYPTLQVQLEPGNPALAVLDPYAIFPVGKRAAK